MTQQPPTVSIILTAARGWIGTPYHHQACVRGVGADCLGLVRGVWREVYGSDAEAPSAYSRDWADATGHETMLGAARQHMTEISIQDAAPGDVLIFRLRPGFVAKHAGIKATNATFIHAMEGLAAAEVPLTPWWQRRIAAVFRFPGVPH
jgi:NlpC/P60 family putative phage cell wall peptidase